MSNRGSTTVEDLMARLRYTHSRLEDSEISTDAVEQIDDELEVTATALNTRMQISGNADTILKPRPSTSKGSQVSERTSPVIPPNLNNKILKNHPDVRY